MRNIEEQIADAFNDGYDEAKSNCTNCSIEFNRGVDFGITMARMKLLSFSELDNEIAMKIDDCLMKMSREQGFEK